MLNRSLAAVPAVLLVLALVACGGDDVDTAASSAATSAAGETAPPPEFPVTVEADNGPVTLSEEPTAIVSLSATATESLFAIGAGGQVTAVDDQSTFPADAPVTVPGAAAPVRLSATG